MFDQTFVNAQAQTRRPWTVAVSLLFQSALVGCALIAPLLHIAKLEAPPKLPIWLPVQVDLNVRPEVKPQLHAATARPVFSLSRLMAPTVVPQHIDLTPDAPEIANSLATTGLPLGEFVAALPAQVQPPQPPVVKPVVKPSVSTPTAPVHVGGTVQGAKLTFGPKPPYPPLARATRTQGTVKIQALIGRDGIIRNLQLVSGPPLLVNVAMEAVRQWRYQPTLLNGEAVEVVTEIDVNFTLSQ